MSNVTKIFNEVEIPVPSRSGFDLSHEVITSIPGAGTLVPLACIPTLPGDKFSIGAMHQISMVPAVGDYYGRVDLKLEAFFVANQSVWAGWNRFISRDKAHNQGIATPGWTIPTHVPTLTIKDTATGHNIGSTLNAQGGLLDCLGMYLPSLASAKINMLPLLAYRKIIDDFYIDKNIMKPFFSEGIPTGTSINNMTNRACMYLPSLRDTIDFTLDGKTYKTSGATVYDKACQGNNGSYLTDFAQRLWAKDIFTTCSTNPQQSLTESSVAITIPPLSINETHTEPGQTAFTIRALRLANSLQKWLERNNIAGFDPSDAQLAHWGVRPSYCSQDKAILLGATTSSVVCKSVGVTNPGQAEGSSQVTNDYAGGVFGTGGDTAGRGSGFGKDSLVDNFECKDHGYIIILGSLVPHRVYNHGIDVPVFGNYETLDYPFPEFVNIGDEPIYRNELGCNPDMVLDISTKNFAGTFGYNQRYGRYKYLKDRCIGLFHNNSTDYIPGTTGGSLQHLALTEQNFASGSTIDTSFLTIPANYLDQVANVRNAISGFAGYGDFYFCVKALRELPQFTLPSL